MRDARPIVIHRDDLHSGVGKRRNQRPLRQEDRWRGILEHVRESIGRIGRIERHIGTARLEDGQHAHHHVEPALDAQTHPRIRPDASGTQIAGELVGFFIELVIRE